MYVLVGTTRRVGQPRVVVDHWVHELIAFAALTRRRPQLAPIATVPAAGRNSAQLLDVDVDELARPLPFVAANHTAGGTVHPVEALQSMPSQHLVASRPRRAQTSRYARGPQLLSAPQGHDMGFHFRHDASRAAERPS